MPDVVDTIQKLTDRELAMRTLMPRRADVPAYDALTPSARAEVDRLVAAFDVVRQGCPAGHLIGSTAGWATYVCLLTGGPHTVHVDSAGRTWTDTKAGHR